MIRTARRLQEVGVSTAIIDLTAIGTVTIDHLVPGLVDRTQPDHCVLTVEIRSTGGRSEPLWGRSNVSPVSYATYSWWRSKAQVVIFIDEIDTTLNLDFADDFFAAIRFDLQCPRYRSGLSIRLTFVLLGVATPSDLIKDRARTPFNIGRAIDLREFSRKTPAVLKQGWLGPIQRRVKPSLPVCSTGRTAILT